MVLLILTPFGLPGAIEAAKTAKASIWLNAGLLRAAEVAELCARGMDVTVMAYWIDPLNREDIEDAMGTVREHHPGRMLFVECPDPAQ